MQDIADELQLSQSTVSLALRNHPSIPETTRKRIANAATRLGYQTNAPISALMARIRANRPSEQHATIAAITRNKADGQRRHTPAFHANWKGAHERAKKLGYQLEEFAFESDGMTNGRLAEILKTRRIEGMIIFPFFPSGELDLPWEQFSAVTIGYNLTAPALHRVSTDQYGAMLRALEQIKARGYRRPGLVIDASLNDRNERRWLSPFCGYELSSGSSLQDSVLLTNGHDEQAFNQWIQKHQPDVVIGCGTLPALKWLKKMRLKIPEDIGLIGLSDAFFYAQDCAYVNENQALVGAAAVDQLVASLHRNERGIPRNRMQLFIPGRWVEGKTLRPAIKT